MMAKSFNRFINESKSVKDVFAEIFLDYFKDATEFLGEIDFDNAEASDGRIIFKTEYTDSLRVGVQLHEYKIIHKFIVYPEYGKKIDSIENQYSSDELLGAKSLKLLDDLIGDPLDYFNGFVAAEEVIVYHPEFGEILKYGDAEFPEEIKWLSSAWERYSKNKEDGLFLGTLSTYISSTLEKRNIPVGPHEIWTAIENITRK